MRYAILVLGLFALVGCGGIRPKTTYVTFTFHNASTNELNGVKLECNDRFLSAGILFPGNQATIFDVKWPQSPTGRVHFIDWNTEKNYSVTIPLTNVNEQVQGGKCKQVTLRILDYDKAEIVCE